MTGEAVLKLTDYHSLPSSGGCKWYGTAPFCHDSCPSGYDYIRSHNGRCGDSWFDGICIPDDSFGKPCTNLIWKYFFKKYCCRLTLSS